jgi:threonine dehydratase
MSNRLNQGKLNQLNEAAQLIYEVLPPTPAIEWPLLNRALGAKLWVKHENHLPTGAFKVRGGLVYVDRLLKTQSVTGLCAATRGNHGQSIAFAAARRGLKAVIVVPKGNNPDKNRAMIALGATLIEHGEDFDESVAYARTYAEAEGLHLVPSFHDDLVLGVATYAYEFLTKVPALTKIYVPIGLGSGICGVLFAKEALGNAVDVIGVVADAFQTYPRSLHAGEPILTEPADSIADGLAVRLANPQALAIIKKGVSRIVTVGENAILGAIGEMAKQTDNLVEGAGAASLAGAFLDRDTHVQDDQIGIVASGGNLEAKVLTRALAL